MLARNSLLRSSVLALPVLLSLAPLTAEAGFKSSGVSLENPIVGSSLLRIPSNSTTGGITHELNAGDWYAFRVKVQHADAAFPLIGFRSDNFTPTSNDIQICDISGCEAPSIDVGDEPLDWSDWSKITIKLEAKACLLCAWQSYDVPLEN